MNYNPFPNEDEYRKNQNIKLKQKVDELADIAYKANLISAFVTDSNNYEYKIQLVEDTEEWLTLEEAYEQLNKLIKEYNANKK